MSRTALEKSRPSLFILFLVILLCLVVAPFTLPSGSVQDLSGRVGSIDNLDQYHDMNLFAQAVYLFGDANCHQIAERSFFLNGNEMPVCSRDLGIFVGAVVGLGISFLWTRKPSLYLVALLVVPIIIEGGWQAISDYESFNALRFLTGILAGVALALFLIWLAYELLAPRKQQKSDGASVIQK